MALATLDVLVVMSLLLWLCGACLIIPVAVSALQVIITAMWFPLVVVMAVSAPQLLTWPLVPPPCHSGSVVPPGHCHHHDH